MARHAYQTRFHWLMIFVGYPNNNRDFRASGHYKNGANRYATHRAFSYFAYMNKRQRCTFAYPWSWIGRPSRTSRKLTGHGGAGQGAKGGWYDSQNGARRTNSGTRNTFCWAAFYREDCHCLGCVVQHA